MYLTFYLYIDHVNIFVPLQVTEVRSDSLMVLDVQSRQEKLVFFSSLKCPRRDEEYSWESKELLRSHCIGKTVRCELDYQRDSVASSSMQDKRNFYTVLLNGEYVLSLCHFALFLSLRASITVISYFSTFCDCFFIHSPFSASIRYTFFE